MPMDAIQKAKVEEYIREHDASNGIGDFNEIISTLTGDEKETKDGKVFNGLKNEDSMLLYAELAMKTEKLKIWEFVKFKLLELELSITSSNFTDFKNFISELKHGNDSSKTVNGNQSLDIVNGNHSSDTVDGNHSSDTVDGNHNIDVADGKVIETAIQTAIQIADDNRYGYEKGGTGDNNDRKGFDCQGFVRYCYIQAGINVSSTGGCETMKEDFEKAGFICIPFDKNKKIRPGDILLANNHTEMCIAKNKIAGAHSDKDKKSGDSDGEEISVRSIESSLSYRNPGYILRYKGDSA